ncbi:hypothetical protein EV702DRAFT_1140106 [Suillus placidus]|uniref:Uncharacterized protein n=1 Tax=Suillus placidus TaxID=48579 RepID=A0A9P6ZKI8_9AGAM|nr:hypothetical protein EV702DRAFT_1140106 [Suillus placidus]
MHEHLGLQLSGAANTPPTPPSTQGAVHSGPGPSPQPSAAGPLSADAGGTAITRPNHARAPQIPAQQPAPQIRQQPNQQQSALPAGSNTPQPQGQPPAQPADEIAALRARIAELERGSAHGNQLPARATFPHQALIADPTAVNRIRANLSSAKDESKKLSLPALQPGHTVSALSLPIPPKVEEAFQLYRYVPYMALTHAARSKAHLRGEDSSFIFTQGWCSESCRREDFALLGCG